MGLGSLSDLFEKEQITLDVLAGMTHDDLKAIGIDAFGVRFRLLKSVEKLNSGVKGEHLLALICLIKVLHKEKRVLNSSICSRSFAELVFSSVFVTLQFFFFGIF